MNCKQCNLRKAQFGNLCKQCNTEARSEYYERTQSAPETLGLDGIDALREFQHSNNESTDGDWRNYD